MSTVRKRKNVASTNKGKVISSPSSNHSSKETKNEDLNTESHYPAALRVVSAFVGVGVMIYCGYIHSWYMYTLHENNMWFTNIKEVEREISFRTESGLYYSYYKQLVHAPSLVQGVQDLISDRLTEYPDTINILERMNIYQEIVLAALYKILPVSMKELPIMFYIKSVFALHGVLVASLFVITWVLAKSWLAGALAAAFYIFNRFDTTRVEYTIPLRECFALPFLWLQAAAITHYFKPSSGGLRQYGSVAVIGVSTFMFCLFWQFNQFIMLLQAFSLFGVWILDVVPAGKVQTVFAMQTLSLLAVCGLQFVNKMILGSLVLSFIPATLLLMAFRGTAQSGEHWLLHAGKVIMYSVLALLLMILINSVIKFVIQVEADEHIFKFLQNKFSGEETRDFDSRLYLCLSIFGFLTVDVYQRLTQGFVLPFYIMAHVILLIVLLLDVLKRWRAQGGTAKENGTDNAGKKETEPSPKKKNPVMKNDSTLLLRTRPELIFHTVQCTLFGLLAMTTYRMKYLWTPYMCVLGAVLLADSQLWGKILSLVKLKSTVAIDACRHAAVAAVLVALMIIVLPSVTKDLQELREFWDPDTVELMEWIQKSTPPMASFSGSMQLMAGVKLCTERPVNNHPHYEDKHLRQKTKQLYQVYGRRTPEDVHAILTALQSHYIILEDSICLAPSKNNCRTPDLVDLDNGVLPDGTDALPGLKRSSVPRFCDEVRYQRSQYAKFFKQVFVNKTFRIYKVM